MGFTDNRLVILLMINLMLLLVGTFMDITPAVLIFTPILLPVVTQMGMTPLHFGIMIVLNLCIGLCTPPVGSVLFVGCGIGKTTIGKVTRPLIPFYMVMILILLAVTFIPWLSLLLPRLFGYI
jgi:TRAP-type C4-dicarboxylate transport system permease large subunit